LLSTIETRKNRSVGRFINNPSGDQTANCHWSVENVPGATNLPFTELFAPPATSNKVMNSLLIMALGIGQIMEVVRPLASIKNQVDHQNLVPQF
jgi:hypothetical protein